MAATRACITGPEKLCSSPPREVVDRVNGETRKALAMADVRESLAKLGLEPGGSTPQDYASMIANEFASWRQVVTAAGIKIE